MARRAEEIGVKKARLDFASLFTLAVIGGAFIALGAVFATVVMSDSSIHLGYGLTKLLGGIAFCLGLILVVIAGGELFTGNNLIVMAWANKRISLVSVLKNWLVVYSGNFVGALGTVILVFLSKSYIFGSGAPGKLALSIAVQKCEYTFVQAVALGILCNGLVCLGVWLTYSARTTTDKVVAILFPVSAFVAAGFEHSIANMYFIPLGLFIKHFDTSWATASGVDTSSLTLSRFLINNLIPVTLGNIVGGSILVALLYWFVYLRTKQNQS
jgi:formate/nitrite transporter